MRRALVAGDRHFSLAVLAAALDVGIPALEGFARGAGLPSRLLPQLAAHIWSGKFRYVVALDALESVEPPRAAAAPKAAPAAPQPRWKPGEGAPALAKPGWVRW